MSTKTKTPKPADEGFSRRDFLRTSATAGLGLALAGKVLGQEKTPAAPAAPAVHGAPRPPPPRTPTNCASRSSAAAPRAGSSSSRSSASRGSASPRSATSGATARPTPPTTSRNTATSSASTRTTATSWPRRRASTPRSSRRPTGCTPSTPTPASGPGSTSTARRRCRTRSRRRGPWSSPPARRASSSRSATSAASNPRYIHAIDRLIREHDPPRPGDRGLRPVEPGQERPPRLAREVRHRPGHARQVRLRLDDRVPQLAPVQEVRRRARWSTWARTRSTSSAGSSASNPRSVVASGGIDYYKNWEWYDNVMAIYEFETPQGVGPRLLPGPDDDPARRLLRDVHGRERLARHLRDPDQGQLGHARADRARVGLAGQGGAAPVRGGRPSRRATSKNIFVDVRVTAEAGRWPLPVELAKPAHQPHLENFFDAVRLGTPLSCPAELAYESCVAVLKANEAVKAGRVTEFRPEQFKA